ncbi:MAG: cupredoxin domain-containing protein [Methanoregula sp.]|nr:cupredoxin domain-containing protein [Methanoregula sp.]
MKRFIGLFILVIVLALISGCTQPAQPAAVPTPVPTTVPTVITTEATLTPTLMPTMEQTPVPTTVTTILSTPKITLVPQTTKTIIYIRNNTFVPVELTVLPGTGITWINEDTIAHSVKITGIHAGMFNSGDIIPTATSGYTFGEVGVYDFICPDHPDMKGTIVVKNGASVVGAPTMQTPSP